jgi:hypothetical protein
MHQGKTRIDKRFIATISGYYLLIALILVAAFKPYISVLDRSSEKLASVVQAPAQLSDRTSQNSISGRPVRLVIPVSSIDIPINQGYYSAASNSWTLSGYYAQFDMSSSLANTASGQTFIYGHNNDFVLGALRHQTPDINAVAYIYTSNGYLFQYSFVSARSLSPTDTSVLSYSGAPTLLIQTCTGSLDEWRTEYSFKFVKVTTD